MTTRTFGQIPKETEPLRIIRNLAAVFFGIILLAVLLFSGSVDYACKHSYTADRQWLLFTIGIVGVAAVLLMAFLLRGKFAGARKLLAKKSTFVLLASICSIVLLLAQCYIVRSTWFETGWNICVG